MADKKISALTAATTPLAGTEVLPIVQGGATVKVSVDNLTTGKVVTTGPIISVGTGKDRLVIEPQNAGSGALLLGTNSAGNAYTPVAVDNSTTILKVSGTEVARTNGNGLAPVAGKGIDFSANGGDVLTQYDEGTWTPVVTPATGAITTYTASGNYTKIGRQVTVNMNIIITTNGTGASALLITGLPFNAATTRFDAGVGREYQTTGNAVAMTFSATNTVQMLNYNNTYPGGDGYYIAASITYNA
jgi:hypothetical protein